MSGSLKSPPPPPLWAEAFSPLTPLSPLYSAIGPEGKHIAIWFNRRYLYLEKNAQDKPELGRPEANTLELPWRFIRELRFSHFSSYSMVIKLTDMGRTEPGFTLFGFDFYGRLKLEQMSQRKQFKLVLRQMSMVRKEEHKVQKTLFFMVDTFSRMSVEGVTMPPMTITSPSHKEAGPI